MPQWAAREARTLLRWSGLGRRKAQGPSLGAWIAGRNRTGSVRRVGPQMQVLRVCPKVRKLAAEVEGRQAKPGAARSVPPSLQPSSQSPLHKPCGEPESARSAQGACSRPRPSNQAPLSPAGDAAGARGSARALPLPFPGEPPPFATRPSSLPLPLPARRPMACELLKRCLQPGRRCAPWGVLLPARHGLPLSPPPRDASSRPQHTVPTPWLPLPPPGPRQVYKHQPGVRFPGSTSPSPSSSPPGSYIHFRARDGRGQPESG